MVVMVFNEEFNVYCKEYDYDLIFKNKNIELMEFFLKWGFWEMIN